MRLVIQVSRHLSACTVLAREEPGTLVYLPAPSFAWTFLAINQAVVQLCILGSLATLPSVSSNALWYTIQRHPHYGTNALDY